MKSICFLFIFSLVFTAFVRVSVAAVDFEQCRKDILTSETYLANSDENGTGDVGYVCSVEILSEKNLPVGSACDATVEFKTTCKNSKKNYSYNGGSCCPF